MTPHAVVLLKRSTVHRTTSGKIQRQACKRDFLGLGLTVVAASVTRDPATPLPAGGLAGLSAAGRRQRVVDAVTEVLTGVPATADAPDVTGWTFLELDLDYPALLTAVRALEERLGTRIPVGVLLTRPRVDTLISLFLGEDPGEEAVEEPSWDAEAVEAWLVEEVATRLGLSAASVDVTRPMASLGLDSKQAVAILAELGARTGREMSTGTAFEHPTIRAVAAHVGTAGRAAGGAASADTPASAGAAASASAAISTAAAPPPQPQPQSQPQPRLLRQPSPRQDPEHEPIAVIGMGCRFPGAPDPDSYWRLLVDGRDAITGVPGGRWATEQVDAPAFGGFVDRVDEFDARFFGLSAREAARMDPQQRLLLETAWQTVEDAGLDPTGLSGTATGVFVGISSHDYSELQMSRLDTIDVHAATGNAHSIAANRLSYTLDLRGPSLAVDTACSSSLLAVHLACESMRRGECDTALVEAGSTS